MLRRNTRLRREYLYRKSLEGKERALYEKKRKIRLALEEGKPIPTELRNEEAALREEIGLEDENTAQLRTHIDDEYAHADEKDPKILLTTSRDPSSRLTQFVKELKIVFPNAQRINRGGQLIDLPLHKDWEFAPEMFLYTTKLLDRQSTAEWGKSSIPIDHLLIYSLTQMSKSNCMQREVISEIVESCRSHDFTDIVVVHEHRGEPDGLIVCHLPFGPTAYFGLINVVTRHDIKDKQALGTMSEAYPQLVFENFTTKLGERTANILKYLFPEPKADCKRVISFINSSDYISFRHHVYEKPAGAKSIDLKEVGPRFELRLYQVKLGTMDQAEAQNEWVIRPYMNSSRKRRAL